MDPNTIINPQVAGTPAAPVSQVTTTAIPVELADGMPPIQVVTPATPPPATPAKRLQLSNEELNERLRRAKASALRDVFGTDDATAIRSRLQKAEELERTAEEQKRAQMTELDRMKYDLQRARQEALRYRSELVTAQEREVVREQQGIVERIATRHINPLYVEEASVVFARELAAKDPREVARWTEKDIARWFQKYCERKPALAASPNARRVQRAPAGADRPAPRPHAPANPQTNSGKTFKPGMNNSMSREEARTEAKKLGYHW